MKMRKSRHLLISLLMTLTLFTGCSEDNSLTEVKVPQKEGQKTDDEVIKALKTIPEISDIEIGVKVVYGEDPNTKSMVEIDEKVYKFNFTQPIDHQNPSQGTYTQRVRLIFKGFDKNVVLHTEGYNFQTGMEMYAPLATQLDANQINVEHRYFGESLPENFEDSHMTYLNADQAAHDLHNLVSVLRKSLFSKGKWVSTGVSKSGITTALQAYYSDKYNWRDIDVFVPFCAPFLTGATYSDGSFSCMDITPCTYLYKNCGNGYEEGTAEAKGYDNLKKIPYYICTHEKIRKAAIKAAYNVSPGDYQKILNQYNQKSPYSTGNKEKDLAAFAISMYFDQLFDKFSYSQYYRWASLVPDMDYLASDNATDTDFSDFENFVFWGAKEVDAALETQESAKRAATADIYWDFLRYRREDVQAPYRIQGFKELGLFEVDYSCVDGSFLTAEQCYKVNYLLTDQYKYDGAYPQDKGKLMSDFLAWVETETTMPLIFVYAYNDPWTGGGVTSDRVKPNPMVVSVVDGIAVHNDYFHDRQSYLQSSEKAIVDALNKFLK